MACVCARARALLIRIGHLGTCKRVHCVCVCVLVCARARLIWDWALRHVQKRALQKRPTGGWVRAHACLREVLAYVCVCVRALECALLPGRGACACVCACVCVRVYVCACSCLGEVLGHVPRGSVRVVGAAAHGVVAPYYHAVGWKEHCTRACVCVRETHCTRVCVCVREPHMLPALLRPTTMP